MVTAVEKTTQTAERAFHNAATTALLLGASVAGVASIAGAVAPARKLLSQAKAETATAAAAAAKATEQLLFATGVAAAVTATAEQTTKASEQLGALARVARVAAAIAARATAYDWSGSNRRWGGLNRIASGHEGRCHQQKSSIHDRTSLWDGFRPGAATSQDQAFSTSENRPAPLLFAQSPMDLGCQTSV
jgi:hypothetical protein